MKNIVLSVAFVVIALPSSLCLASDDLSKEFLSSAQCLLPTELDYGLRIKSMTCEPILVSTDAGMQEHTQCTMVIGFSDGKEITKFFVHSCRMRSVNDPDLLFVIQSIANHMGLKREFPVYEILDDVNVKDSDLCLAGQICHRIVGQKINNVIEKIGIVEYLLLGSEFRRIKRGCQIQTLYHEMQHVKQCLQMSAADLINGLNNAKELSSAQKEQDADRTASDLIRCVHCLDETALYKDEHAANTDSLKRMGYMTKPDYDALIDERLATNRRSICRGHWLEQNRTQSVATEMKTIGHNGYEELKNYLPFMPYDYQAEQEEEHEEESCRNFNFWALLCRLITCKGC